MRLLKWIILFSIAFIAAWVLIFTFTQAPFKELVPARVLAYNTPPIPIYIYVAGAFGAGLLVGLFWTVYYYIALRAKVGRQKKQIRTLENDVDQIKKELEQSNAELEQTKTELGRLVQAAKEPPPPRYQREENVPTHKNENAHDGSDDPQHNKS